MVLRNFFKSLGPVLAGLNRKAINVIGGLGRYNVAALKMILQMRSRKTLSGLTACLRFEALVSAFAKMFGAGLKC